VRALTAKHGLKIDHHVAFADADQDDPEVWPDEVDGYQLIKDVRYAIHRYVEMEKEQRMACALWVLHAHAHEAADCSPLLVITAPTPECGKSQLVQCLEYLVPRPFPTANATPASIFYEIRHNKPTILMDEGETSCLKKATCRAFSTPAISAVGSSGAGTGATQHGHPRPSR
jgi:hypothetical protein